MQNNENKKQNRIETIASGIVSVLGIIFLAGFIFYIFFLFLAFGGEHIISKEGEPYTMHNVELLKNIELINTSNSVTYNFVAKRNSNRTEILLHFNNLSISNDIARKNQKVQELCKFYNQANVSLYDDTNKKLIFKQKIDYNFLMFTDSNIMVIANNIPISEHHKYHIVIDNLPTANDITTSYNSFILVIGQRAIAPL